MIDQNLTYRPETKTVIDLVNLYEDGVLNLEPGFQRQSVWAERDRAKLIDSILRNYPLPAIFLYRREEAGHIYYDVIDGKQRLESILMFMGEMRGRFWVKTELPGDEEPVWVDWKRLCKRKCQHRVTGFRIPVIEVDGTLGDIIEVFVRINSTGKALTPQEKRRAKFYNSAFLKEADRLSRKFQPHFMAEGILSSAQISRMKHVELVAELMLSISQRDVINKKSALDRVMRTDGTQQREISRAAKATATAINRVKAIFPKLHCTRFTKSGDYYSLVNLIARLEDEGYILTDRKRNALASDLLIAFSTKVDELREKQRHFQPVKSDEDLYRRYFETVRAAIDNYNQRKARENILRSIFETLFAKKDQKRTFTAEQRRILWNSTAMQKCNSCGKLLTWENFTLDHVDPHSKGGRSQLDNAALMCQSCNSSKGNRRRR
jgi:hypothetical protein